MAGLSRQRVPADVNPGLVLVNNALLLFLHELFTRLLSAQMWLVNRDSKTNERQTRQPCPPHTDRTFCTIDEPLSSRWGDNAFYVHAKASAQNGRGDLRDTFQAWGASFASHYLHGNKNIEKNKKQNISCISTNVHICIHLLLHWVHVESSQSCYFVIDCFFNIIKWHFWHMLHTSHCSYNIGLTEV